MDDLNLAHADDNSLAKLMDLSRSSGGLWSPQELGAILGHQLAAPLELDLGTVGDAKFADRIAGYAHLQPPIHTFGDLVFHPRPPVELLEFVKEFSKSCRGGADGILPDEIATVLYALGIAAAMTKCERRITQLDDQALRHLMDWVGQQTWLDTASRELANSARKMSMGKQTTNGHE